MTRRLASTSCLALVLAACGGETSTDERMESRVQARRAHIEQLVRAGDLPPVARLLIAPDGAMNLDFIDGPKYAKDVVRTSADGSRGRKLVWDLDRDGRIDRSERTITEDELYTATTW